MTSRVEEIGVGRICARFGRDALRRPGGLAGLAAIMAANSLLTVLQPWPLKVLVDNVLSAQPLRGAAGHIIAFLPGAGSRQGLLAWSVGATVAVFMLNWCAATARAYADVAFGQRLVYDVAERIFDRLQRLSLGFHARQGVGDSLRRVTADSECASVIVTEALLPVAAAVVTLGLMVAIMWRLDPRLTVVAVAVVPLLVVAVRRYSAAMQERSYELQAAEGSLSNTVEETLSAIPIVAAFGLEATTDQQVAEDTDAVLDAAVAEASAQFRFKVGTGAAVAMGTAAIMWFGARQVIDGHLTVGTILVFLAYLTALYTPLSALMSTSSTLQQAAGSGRRVLEVLGSEPEVGDRPGAVPLGRVVGRVDFDGVSFGYDPRRPVLDGVSFEVAAGETVAIVGATGAGKSTLAALVPRFYDPQSGVVRIDGRDLRELQVASVRSQVALVLQDAFLFPVSVAANIGYGRPGASEEEIVAAARAANAHRFISALRDGYKTVLGERGATLSGGERQRLSIARAVLKDAPILILDEPTSALDALTESEVMEAVERLRRGRTTLVIAHRLSTIKDADRIVVLDAGRVVQCGSHRQLIGQPGPYANLHRLQTALPVTAAAGERR